VHAGALLEHLLRALSADVPPADIYHASSNGLASLIAMVGKWKYDAPFILTEHGIYLRERYMALGYRDATYPVRMLVLRFVRLLTSAAYLVADLITPGSRYNRRWQERNGADPAKVRPIHNGVDHREFPDAGPEPAAPTLVWVGRIDPLKDLETLIRAADIVRKHIPNFRLRMYGSVPVGNEAYAERCQALLDRLDLAGHARFEGRIPVILDAYSAASVVVLSSRSEGFPYTVIEAMMSGRATVSTDVGGVGEAVGDAGLVVPPRDPKAFAEACIDLLQDHKRRYLLSQAARVRALKYFTLQQFLGIYREIYLELGATPVPEAVLAAGEPRDDPAEFVGLESVPAT
jgi:glycosyltransferase involved in cell wall biosynthesis